MIGGNHGTTAAASPGQGQYPTYAHVIEQAEEGTLAPVSWAIGLSAVATFFTLLSFLLRVAR